MRSRRLRVPDVQPALALRRVLPPPAAGALVLTRQDCARTRLTADRNEATLVEVVERDAVLPDEGPGFGGAPAGQWIELHEASVAPGVRLVDLHDGDRRSRGGALIAALPGRPGAQLGEGTSKGFD